MTSLITFAGFVIAKKKISEMKQSLQHLILITNSNNTSVTTVKLRHRIRTFPNNFSPHQDGKFT